MAVAQTLDFEATLAAHGSTLRRARPHTLQVNVGKRCNQACHHCHVDAGPKRTEIMTRPTVDCILAAVEANPALATVDVTGGAPELNPSFAHLVEGVRALGRSVMVRCNLTVLLAEGTQWVAEFYRRHGVTVVASLPCYSPDNVDSQRGVGVFDASIRALERLNGLGYGRSDGALRLDLVYNPVGAFLPGPEAELEARYRHELRSRFGIEFDRLLTITNMPIARFAEALRRAGDFDRYMGLLVNHFNPDTVGALMCRHLVSVDWEGRLYDCDFNQMLGIPIGAPGARDIGDPSALRMLSGAPVATGTHCFGCTAGAGSSCGGALA